MALREVGASGEPDFSDPSVSFFQFLSLYVRDAENGYLGFGTYQNDCNWGLCLEAIPPGAPLSDLFEGIFRTRHVAEIPCGVVNSVSVRLDESGDLERVELRIGSFTVELIAGEVYESKDGSLTVQLGGDESVLVSVRTDA